MASAPLPLCPAQPAPAPPPFPVNHASAPLLAPKSHHDSALATSHHTGGGSRASAARRRRLGLTASRRKRAWPRRARVWRGRLVRGFIPPWWCSGRHGGTGSFHRDNTAPEPFPDHGSSNLFDGDAPSPTRSAALPFFPSQIRAWWWWIWPARVFGDGAQSHGDDGE